MDKNNFYHYAISKFLLTFQFKWLDSAKLNGDKYDDNSLRSCVLDVDLEYLKVSHKLLNDYPLAPEKLEKQNKNEGNLV